MWIIKYIKKFLWMLAIVFLVSFLFNIFVNVTGLIRNTYYFRYFFGLAVCIAIVLPFIKKIKHSDYDKREIFIKAKENTKSKAIIALKSADFRQEVIVFLVFISPFILRELISDFSSIYEFIFVFFFTIILIGLCYGLLSFLLLIWVYHSWEKEGL